MIRFAMGEPDRPVWASGSPDNKRHLASAGSAVAKFLGKAAEQAPDWPTVAWIVRTCVPPDEQDPLLARMAGRWCAATGESWPSGYIGAVDRGGKIVEHLTDPEQAPDDATRVRLYQQLLNNAERRIAEL